MPNDEKEEKKSLSRFFFPLAKTRRIAAKHPQPHRPRIFPFFRKKERKDIFEIFYLACAIQYFLRIILPFRKKKQTNEELNNEIITNRVQAWLQLEYNRLGEDEVTFVPQQVSCERMASSLWGRWPADAGTDEKFNSVHYSIPAERLTNPNGIFPIHCCIL